MNGKNMTGHPLGKFGKLTYQKPVTGWRRDCLKSRCYPYLLMHEKEPFNGVRRGTRFCPRH